MKSINWGQAFAEVLLLLLGIAAALVVDQWRDGSEARATEQAHLAALRTDFVAADEFLRVRLGALEEQMRHNEALLRILNQPVGSVSPDSITGMIRKAFVDITFRSELPSYTDLVNSGDLGLIQSDDLRRALAEFEVAHVEASDFARKASEQWAGPVTEFFIQHLNATEIYGVESPVSWDAPGIPDFPAYSRTPVVTRVEADEDALWSRVCEPDRDQERHTRRCHAFGDRQPRSDRGDPLFDRRITRLIHPRLGVHPTAHHAVAAKHPLRLAPSSPSGPPVRSTTHSFAPLARTVSRSPPTGPIRDWGRRRSRSTATAGSCSSSTTV